MPGVDRSHGVWYGQCSEICCVDNKSVEKRRTEGCQVVQGPKHVVCLIKTPPHHSCVLICLFSFFFI